MIPVFLHIAERGGQASRMATPGCRDEAGENQRRTPPICTSPSNPLSETARCYVAKSRTDFVRFLVEECAPTFTARVSSTVRRQIALLPCWEQGRAEGEVGATEQVAARQNRCSYEKMERRFCMAWRSLSCITNHAVVLSPLPQRVIP